MHQQGEHANFDAHASPESTAVQAPTTHHLVWTLSLIIPPISSSKTAGYPSAGAFFRNVAVGTGVSRSQLASKSHAHGNPASRTRLNVSEIRVDRFVSTPSTYHTPRHKVSRRGKMVGGRDNSLRIHGNSKPAGNTREMRINLPDRTMSKSMSYPTKPFIMCAIPSTKNQRVARPQRRSIPFGGYILRLQLCSKHGSRRV